MKTILIIGFLSIFFSLSASAQSSSPGSFDLAALIPLLVIGIIFFVVTFIRRKNNAAREAQLESRFDNIEKRLNSLEGSK